MTKTTPERAECLRAALERYLLAMGCDPDLACSEVTEDDDRLIIGFAFGDIGVSLDHEWHAGEQRMTGYRVWIIKHTLGTRETPPELWDETVLESASLREVAMMVEAAINTNRRRDALDALVAATEDLAPQGEAL